MNKKKLYNERNDKTTDLPQSKVIKEQLYYIQY